MGEVITQLQRVFLAAAIGVTVLLALREDLPETPEVSGDLLQHAAFPHGFQKRGVDLAALHASRAVAPCGKDALHLLRFFRGGVRRAGHDGGDSVFMLRRGCVDHPADRFHLPIEALRFVCGGDGAFLQGFVMPLALMQPIQKSGKIFLRFVLCLMQLIQRVERTFIAPDVRKQAIQLFCSPGDELRRRLIGGQLASLADALDGRKIVALHDVVKNTAVELLGHDR